MARPAAGRARRLSGHAGVLAVGADRPDRQSAARPRLLLAPDFPFYTLFAGQFFPAADLPWAYLPTYIALALPELVLVLLLVRRCAAGRRFGARRCPLAPRNRRSPLHARLRDRLPGRLRDRDQGGAVRRHAAFHLRAAADRRGGGRAPIAGSTGWRGSDTAGRSTCALALYGVAHVSIMAMLHPDQYVYYNAFVGGVEGAQRKFKLDYWANSYAEAVQGLEDYLRAEYGADFKEHEFTVAVCGPPVSADYYFPPNFLFVRDRDQADFFIAFTKDNCDRSLPGRQIYRVERMGALLSVVLDRRDLVAERQAACHIGRPRLLAGPVNEPPPTARNCRRKRARVERSEYDKLDRVEDRMWWFAALHANLLTGSRGDRRSTSSICRSSTPAAAPADFFRRLARQITASEPVIGLDLDSGPARAPPSRARGPSAPARSTTCHSPMMRLAAIFSADVLCHAGSTNAALCGSSTAVSAQRLADPQPAGLSLDAVAA